MKPEPVTWRELLPHLPGPETGDVLAQRLAVLHHEEERPWILNLFAGIGAWFSTLFMLPFFYLAHVFDSAASCGIFGVLMFAGGIGLSRKSQQVFLGQLALSALLCGTSLMLVTVLLANESNEHLFGVMVAVQTVLATVACLFFRGAVGRFLNLVAVPALAVAWLFDLKSPHGLHVITGLLAVSAGLLHSWGNRPRSWDVVAWAAILALPCMILLIELLHGQPWQEGMVTPLWPSSVVLGLVLLWQVAHEALGRQTFGRGWFGFMAVVTVLLAAFTTPGIVVAMLLLFLARAKDETVLSILGHLFFAAFLVLFYYALNVSLAQKSGVVIGSGLLLLVVRWVIGRLAGKGALA